MKCSINRIQRTNFDEDVNKAYDADKEFIVSYTDAHIVELVLTFFGMEDIHSTQTKNEIPSFHSDEERKSWIYKTIGTYVLAHLTQRVRVSFCHHPVSIVCR